jgi:hypothetical protein
VYSIPADGEVFEVVHDQELRRTDR